MLYIYSYDNQSESVKLLRDHLGDEARLIRHENSQYYGTPDRTVLNWGTSQLPYQVMCSKVINHPKRVQRAINKIKFLEHSAEQTRYKTPEFTTDKSVALGWINEGHTVVERQQIKGHASKGIHITTPDDDQLGDAPLYTKYVKKKREFRVHAFNGDYPSLVQEKKLMHGVEATDQDYSPF